MGCFDTVFVKCPLCGFTIEFQSKAGCCKLERYSMREVPIEVALDLAETSKQCHNCESIVTLSCELPKTVLVRAHACAKSANDVYASPATDEDYPVCPPELYMLPDE